MKTYGLQELPEPSDFPIDEPVRVGVHASDIVEDVLLYERFKILVRERIDYVLDRYIKQGRTDLGSFALKVGVLQSRTVQTDMGYLKFYYVEVTRA